MSEAKQLRGDAVFRDFVSPGLQARRKRLLFALAIGLTLASLPVHRMGISLFDKRWADIDATVPVSAIEPGNTVAKGTVAPEEAGAPFLDGHEEELDWLELEVGGGDTLAKIFMRAGYDEQHVHDLISQSEDGQSLARIFPGQTFAFQADEAGQLLGVRHIKSPLEIVTYELTEQGFERKVDVRSPDPREAWTTGVIKSSLFMAGEEAGLSQGMIMDMANIFGGVVDFALDPRRGDTMQLVYEELFLDGEKLSDGDIIAASFTNQGETFNAFRYTDSNGDTNYYNEDGVSMKKSFLMAPLDFTRISSNFNMRRLHPIYKTTRPHRGTDYAAPTGTPVYAAGAGRIVKAGYTRTNGNYVFIQHGEQYVTRYLHLQKRMVNVGQRVSQSQLIGTVGATGAATGPHLHYEFLVNGMHRNPRTIYKELPKAKKLPSSELDRFEDAIAQANDKLTALRASDKLAMNDLNESKTAPN
jgi:murein DD-endopeptidase MepM/ murein hydrolase activator NlpD